MKTTAAHSALPLLQAPAALAENPAFTFRGLLLAALPGLALLFHPLASPAFKGWLGEKFVIRAALRKLDPPIYQHFHDLFLPRLDGQGITRIGHVVVSAFGVLVIDARKYRGWITDTSGPDEWTQQVYHRSSQLRNPVAGNQLNLGALRAVLGLPANRFQPMVFFIGGAGFKTPIPENVLTRGLRPWILSHDKAILGPTARQRAVEKLTELSRSPDRKAAMRQPQSAAPYGAEVGNRRLPLEFAADAEAARRGDLAGDRQAL